MSTPLAVDAQLLRWTGRLSNLTAQDRASLLQRAVMPNADIVDATAIIVESVKLRGDEALIELARDLDSVSLQELEVPKIRLTQALDKISRPVRTALERSARNIATVHAASLPRIVECEPESGIRITRRPDPLTRVGVYAPGGRASYPSSVLMGAVPARVAGVREVILCVPPASDGAPASVSLAAAAIAGVDRVFAIGGAGAIAAMAYGTRTVPTVDKIVGPGNAFVTEAKRQLAGIVATDTLAGPSEVIVVADRSATAESVIAELLAQAEHDPAAVAIAIVLDNDLANDVIDQLSGAIAREPRFRIISRALSGSGGVFVADSVDEAIAFVNAFAPEHLALAVTSAEKIAARITTAGTICIGAGTSVAFGDYLTGANHILPTSGAARAASGVSVLDFFRWTSIQEVTGDARRSVASDVGILAEAEGLPAHARAAAVATSAVTIGERFTPARLDDNTQQWSSSPEIQRALVGMSASIAGAYPSVRGDRARDAIAEYIGVDREWITLGCGSDEILDSAFRAFAIPGEKVAYQDPTFSMVPIYARANRLQSAPVCITDDPDADCAQLLDNDAAIIYLCSPNNPTGGAIPRNSVERILRDAGGIVILDEAYAEFASRSDLDLVKECDRLLVLRTLSKAFGLAGLRVGYAVGQPELISRLNEVRSPYPVNAFAETAAIAAVGAGVPWMRDRVAETKNIRERFLTALSDNGISALQSDANFVLITGINAVDTAAALERVGIHVRLLRALNGIGDAIRISIAPWNVMERALIVLREAAQ
ncbi:MAG TPA: histidinol dehydrogenase [Gemmatimonadaceae bacterium]|nr:histidinol dehydrogenase [Gemmatimonadaceae bacterium]